MPFDPHNDSTPDVDWNDLIRQLKYGLASNASVATVSVAGRTVSYRSISDMLQALRFAQEMAAQDAGNEGGFAYLTSGGR